MSGVETREETQSNGADQGEDDGETREDFLANSCVGDQAALVSQPPVGRKGEIQEDGRDDAPGNEERFQFSGTDVRNVGNVLSISHGRIVYPFRVDDPVNQETQKGRQPHHAGDDGKPLRRVSAYLRPSQVHRRLEYQSVTYPV